MHRHLALLFQANHKQHNRRNILGQQLDQLQGDAANNLGDRLDGLSLGRDFVGRCALLEVRLALKSWL